MLYHPALAWALAALALPSAEAHSNPRSRHALPAHHAEARDTAFNPHHAYRDIMERAVSADAAGIDGKTYDFIVVGGGVAGLVIAARLSEMQNQTVLVIEAGGDGSDVVLNQQIPGYTYHKGIVNKTPYGWNTTTIPQSSANGTVRPFPLGRGLGGSGAINGMFWCRGAKEEYDAWGELNPGSNVTWNWDEMDRYIKKSENLQMPPQETIDKFHMPIDQGSHGKGGPLQVGWSQYIYPVIENWIPTFVNLGVPAHDLSDGKTRGVMITPSTLDASTQSRSDSRTSYLDPNKGRENLFVLTHHQATRIFFNGTKDASGNLVASGVEFQMESGAPVGKAFTAKEIIVSAGTVHSPQLLQLSGVGPANILEPLGIKTLLDLPVGHNFQDHVSHAMFWDTIEGLDTWFDLGSSEELKAQALEEYEKSRTGPWTYINAAVAYASMPDLSGSADAANALGNGVNIDATVKELAAKYNMPASVQAGIAAQYNIQKRWLGTDVGQLEYIMHLWGKSATSLGIQVCMQHAWARGLLSISSTDPFAMPNIDPNYFGVEIDETIMNQASEWIRKYAQTAPMNTVLTTESIPGAAVTGDALNTYLRGTAGTEYHPMSTCSMLPKDKGGVVDTNLVVYGTANLRVADASIMPIHVSAHLMASTYGVAEKVSDLIKERTQKFLDGINAPKSTVKPSAASTSARASHTASPSPSASKDVAGKSNADSSPLSTGAKIGIGVGAAVGALLLIGAIIAFFMWRRSSDEPPKTKNGWYEQGAANGQWAGADHYRAGEAYPMNPNSNFRGRPSHDGSIASMATADLPARPGRADDSRYGLSTRY